MRPTLRTHSMAELAAWARRYPCPKCHAPAGLPCLDFRSYDKVLYGVRTHKERQLVSRS